MGSQANFRYPVPRTIVIYRQIYGLADTNSLTTTLKNLKNLFFKTLKDRAGCQRLSKAA